MLKFKIKSPVSGIFLVLFYFTTVSDSSANKEQEYKSSAEDISNQIKSLSKSLNTSKALLKNESDKLSELEQEIHTLSKSTKQTKELINQQKEQNRLIEDQQKSRKTKTKWHWQNWLRIGICKGSQTLFKWC